jgi:hypothetical protein
MIMLTAPAPKPIYQFRSTDILKRLKRKQSSPYAVLKSSSLYEREKKKSFDPPPCLPLLAKKKKVAFDEPTQ